MFDDEDTRMGYDPRSYHELVQFQRGGLVKFEKKRMSDGADDHHAPIE